MGDYNYTCAECPRTFKLEEFYEKHKKVHQLKKQHRCDVCGFVYGAAKGLEGHMKTHSEAELVAASLAGKAVNGVNTVPIAAAAAVAPNSEPPLAPDFHFLNPRGVLAAQPTLV